MRQFFDLFVANFKMTVRNKQALFWLFVFPLLMMALFGIVFGGGETKPKLALVDHDDTELSRGIADGFTKSKVVKVYRYSNQNKAKSNLKQGNLDGVLVVNKGFARDVTRIMAVNRKQTAKALGEMLRAEQARRRAAPSGATMPTAPESGVLEQTPPGSENDGAETKRPAPVQVELYYDPAATFTSQVVRGAVANVLGFIDRSLNQTPDLLALKSHSVRQRGLQYIDFLVPGIIAMTLMNSAMFGLAGTIVNYRERGILRRLKVTPQPLTTFLAAQITNQLIFSILRAALLIGAATLLFGVQVVGSYSALVVIIIIGSLAFVTIAFTIASFSKNREIADTLSQIISMPMMFLGGVFFPVDGAPAWIKPIIQALPLKYLADAMRAVMIKGDSLYAVRSDMYILSAVTLVFFIFAMKLWRWE